MLLLDVRFCGFFGNIVRRSYRISYESDFPDIIENCVESATVGFYHKSIAPIFKWADIHYSSYDSTETTSVGPPSRKGYFNGFKATRVVDRLDLP